MLRVIISSTIRDLRYVRSTLADKISGALGHQAVVSESVGFDYSTGGNIIDSCLREVETSDVYVLVLGERYGSEIEPGLSITKAEYLQAKAARKTMLILVEQDAWNKYQIAPDQLDPNLKLLLDEVSLNFQRKVHVFASSEEAFEYIRAQLSLILKAYLQSGLQPQDISAIMEEKSRLESCNRVYVNIIAHSTYHEGNLDRILSVFSQEIRSGTICNDAYVPQPLVELSNVTGATLYKFVEADEQLLKVGKSGDVGGSPRYDLYDPNSFVGSAMRSGEAKVIYKDAIGYKECVMCILIGSGYVLTLHFLILREHAAIFDENFIIDAISEWNQPLFAVLNEYLTLR